MKKYHTLEIASYVSYCYNKKFEKEIDQMKLHHLIYFVQIEYLVRTGDILIDEMFYGWKFGPILKSIRKAWNLDCIRLIKYDNVEIDCDVKNTVDFILNQFGRLDSWTLSRLITEHDLPYKNSRIGIKCGENADHEISLFDMRKAAKIIHDNRQYNLVTKFKNAIQS